MFFGLAFKKEVKWNFSHRAFKESTEEYKWYITLCDEFWDFGGLERQMDACGCVEKPII